MTVSELPALVLPTTRTGHPCGTHDLVVLDGDPGHRTHDIGATFSDLLRERNGVRIIATTEALPQTPAAGARSATASMSIQVSHAQLAHYGAGMSDATLWRLYHAIPVQPEFRPDWWTAYVTVNRRFAEAAGQVAAEKATVWITSHRLQLVPAMLRSARPDLALGYTSRIPFPPPELFTRLPWKRPLLHGLAAADLIGLPRRVDVLNFLSTARRLAPGTPKAHRVDRPAGAAPGEPLPSQPVLTDLTSTGWLDTLSLGPAAPTLLRAPGPRHAELAQQLRSTLGNPGTLLLGVDPLDPTRGIPQRLDAIAALLRDGLLDPATTVYVQAAAPSPHDPQGDLRHLVETAVARINGTFASIGRPVIHYLHRPLPPDQLTALYLAADVLISTPLSDDLSPAVAEYLAARSDGGGALILSEFSGYAEQFPEAVAVNPYDTQALQEAIARTTTSGAAEATRRTTAARLRLTTHDSRQAISEFLQAVAGARAARPDPRQPADQRPGGFSSSGGADARASANCTVAPGGAFRP